MSKHIHNNHSKKNKTNSNHNSKKFKINFKIVGFSIIVLLILIVISLFLLGTFNFSVESSSDSNNLNQNNLDLNSQFKGKNMEELEISLFNTCVEQIKNIPSSETEINPEKLYLFLKLNYDIDSVDDIKFSIVEILDCAINFEMNNNIVLPIKIVGNNIDGVKKYNLDLNLDQVSELISGTKVSVDFVK